MNMLRRWLEIEELGLLRKNKIPYKILKYNKGLLFIEFIFREDWEQAKQILNEELSQCLQHQKKLS